MILSEEVRELEKDLEFKQKECDSLKEELARSKRILSKYEELSKSMIPVKIYTHKARRHTTVKFLDNSQQTVTRIKGEKDCIETAIVYAVLKQLLRGQDLKKLIKEREEH